MLIPKVNTKEFTRYGFKKCKGIEVRRKREELNKMLRKQEQKERKEYERLKVKYENS